MILIVCDAESLIYYVFRVAWTGAGIRGHQHERVRPARTEGRGQSRRAHRVRWRLRPRRTAHQLGVLGQAVSPRLGSPSVSGYCED